MRKYVGTILRGLAI